ncbi:MAG: hypothetical protein IK008_05785 [Bacteroidales bacterium]|nr:hypothetical protein [Bacteroidales bacterium]
MSNVSHKLEREVSGLFFTNPVGVPYTIKKRGFSLFRPAPKSGFLTLTPPEESVMNWIRGLEKKKMGNCVLAVNVNTDIVRTFSLVYDFAGFIIVDPDSDKGIDASDISDTQVLIDELVSLRLCYERYTPFFLRLRHGISEEELHYLLGACRLAGLDGVAAPARMVSRINALTEGRLTVIASANSQEEALRAFREGASLLELNDIGPIGVKKLLKKLETQ